MLLLLLVKVAAATAVVIVVVGSIARHDQHCFGVITTTTAAAAIAIAIAGRDAARVAGCCRDAIIIMRWYRSLSFSPPLLVC